MNYFQLAVNHWCLTYSILLIFCVCHLLWGARLTLKTVFCIDYNLFSLIKRISKVYYIEFVSAWAFRKLLYELEFTIEKKLTSVAILSVWLRWYGWLLEIRLLSSIFFSSVMINSNQWLEKSPKIMKLFQLFFTMTNFCRNFFHLGWVWVMGKWFMKKV